MNTIDTENPALVEAIIDILDRDAWDKMEMAQAAIAELTHSGRKYKSYDEIGPMVRKIRRRQYIDVAEKIRKMLSEIDD